MTAVMNDRPATTAAGTSSRGAWRPLLRLGRRDAARRKGRTALVVVLVALPVALLIVAAVLLQSANLTHRGFDLLRLGRTADAMVYAPTTAAGSLPPSWDRTQVDNFGYLRVKANGRFRFATVMQASLGHPLLDGAYVVTGGVAPQAADTASVSTEFARRYGVRRGDGIAMRDGQAFRVVGTFEQADRVNEPSVILPVRPTVVRPDTAFSTMFVKAPTFAEFTSFMSSGVGGTLEVGVTRLPFDGRPASSSFDGERLMPTVILYSLGTIGLFLVGIVISAAFAVSARRQLRTLGLLSANGATPTVLARAMAAQGVVTGIAGTLLGFGLGAAGLAALAPHLNRFLGRRLPGLVVPPVQLVTIAVMGVATAAIAAWLPGRAVARVPTLAALGGRRPVETVKAHVPAIGVVLFAGGLALLAVTSAAGSSTSNQLARWAQLVGSVGAMMLGGVLCMPWIVGHGEALARRWKGSRRLAARSLARNRSRSGPIAAAILVTAGAAMVAATFDESNHDQAQQFRQRVEPRTVAVRSYDETGGTGFVAPPEDALALVRQVLPSATIVRYTELSYDGTPLVRGTPESTGSVFVTMDPDSLRRLAGDAAADAYVAGRAVVLQPSSVVEGDVVTLDLERRSTGSETPDETTASSVVAEPVSRTTVRLPAVGPPEPVDLFDTLSFCEGDCPVAPVVVLPESVASANGFRANYGPIVQFRMDRLLSDAERQQIRELNVVLQEESNDRAEQTGQSFGVVIDVSDVSGERNRNLQLILTSIVLVLALGVAAIGLALTSTENRADDATLLALGAPPRFRRRVRFWEALLLTAAGALPAVPLGYAIGAVSISSGTTDWPLSFPWRTALVLGVALPLVAAGLFWVFARTPRIVLVRED